MAIYHLHAKVFKRSKGQSATAAVAYRSGDLVECERTGRSHDYTRKSGVVCSEILAPEDAESWVFDRSVLWNRVEQTEKRKDAQVAREVEISLPRELNHAQRMDLVRGFVRENFTNLGMIADVSVHDTGNGNPHAHIMLTMRDLEADGFGQKNRSWNDRAMLEQWRESWAQHANAALSEFGHSAQIDHRSFKDQGSAKKPTKHHGNRETLAARLIRNFNYAASRFNRLLDRLADEQRPEPKPKPKPKKPELSPLFTDAYNAIMRDFHALQTAAKAIRNPDTAPFDPQLLEVTDEVKKRAQEQMRKRKSRLTIRSRSANHRSLDNEL